ncbi:MAG: DNA polymerase III subunit epsilon [Pedobacter sp.]|nr:MAG: DNA polymerase III subunit epsilon [Pedobacter sp.]
MLYAVVDIETTGSYAAQNSITEIAIIIHNGKQVTQRFQSLFKVDQEIPPFIEALTGINNHMLKNEPYFEDLAPLIYSLLYDKIFVAHNVNFDYSFVKYQLDKCGYTLNCPKLCTVRLSRKIIPNLPSYSLGKLCHAIGIEIHDRHRAMGDAEATATLFTRLVKEDSEQIIAATLKKGSKEQVLPPHLDKNSLIHLPSSPGIYYFQDQKGKNVYIGKAINLKKRVFSHFVGNNPSKQRQNFLREIHHVSYQECATELMALILEVTEIKHYWPKYNRSLKRFEQRYSLFKYVDQNGYYRLAIDKYKPQLDHIWTFNDMREGYQIIRTFVNSYELCENLCYNHLAKSALNIMPSCQCTSICSHPDEHVDNSNNGVHTQVYNDKVLEAIDNFQMHLPSFLVVDQGRNAEENSYLWIEKGKLIGMAYLSNTFQLQLEVIRDALKLLPSNPYTMQLIYKFKEQYPSKVIPIEEHLTYKESNAYRSILNF